MSGPAAGPAQPDRRAGAADVASFSARTTFSGLAILGSGVLKGNEFAVAGRGNFWSDYTGYDENGDGKPDRRFTYTAGALVLIETEPDASGTFTKRLDVR